MSTLHWGKIYISEIHHLPVTDIGYTQITHFFGYLLRKGILTLHSQDSFLEHYIGWRGGLRELEFHFPNGEYLDQFCFYCSRNSFRLNSAYHLHSPESLQSFLWEYRQFVHLEGVIRRSAAQTTYINMHNV